MAHSWALKRKSDYPSLLFELGNLNLCIRKLFWPSASTAMKPLRLFFRSNRYVASCSLPLFSCAVAHKDPLPSQTIPWSSTSTSLYLWVSPHNDKNRFRPWQQRAWMKNSAAKGEFSGSPLTSPRTFETNTPLPTVDRRFADASNHIFGNSINWSTEWGSCISWDFASRGGW